ncbi:MAG: YdeI/OmpD-associated family protein [Bacteroidetes bacterium]|nr:YdeI/OmpD-associated family protein [Bacteroidota bacterium]
MNPKVNWFFEKDTPWREEYHLLRTIALSTGLTEELKWGCPCYTHGKANVVLIHGFKDYCALLFMKGVLLKDTKKVLIQQTANVQSARQWRFTNAKEIVKDKATIKAYIKEAWEIEKAGLQVAMKKTKEFDMPVEFKNVLKEMPDVKKAFEKLTPGRQRGYLLHFSSAKQTKTREARIEKYIPAILQGKGLED